MRNFWHQVRLDGNVKLKKLLIEMLDAGQKSSNAKVVNNNDLDNEAVAAVVS